MMVQVSRRVKVALVAAVVAAAATASVVVLSAAAEGMTLATPRLACSGGKAVVSATVNPGRVKASRWAVKVSLREGGRRVSSATQRFRRPSAKRLRTVRKSLGAGSASYLTGCRLTAGQALSLTVYALSADGRRVRARATSRLTAANEAPSTSTGEGEAGPGAPAGADVPVSPATAQATRSTVLGAVPAPVNEASGLAASHRNGGVVWTHNDSGGAASLYALGGDGSIRATVPITGATNRDWEDMARGPGPTGSPDWLYVGDIGDNGGVRGSVRVYRVREPDLAGVPAGGTVSVAASGLVNLVYPDGPRDAEALIVDPLSGDLFLVTKREARSRVYRAAAPSFAGETVPLEFQRELAGNLITAADACPDGKTVLVRSYLGLDAYVGSSVADSFRATPSPRLVEVEPQGETVAAAPDCEGYYTLSEGSGQPLVRYLR
jgi:hypothetical protein